MLYDCQMHRLSLQEISVMLYDCQMHRLSLQEISVMLYDCQNAQALSFRPCAHVCTNNRETTDISTHLFSRSGLQHLNMDWSNPHS